MINAVIQSDWPSGDLGVDQIHDQDSFYLTLSVEMTDDQLPKAAAYRVACLARHLAHRRMFGCRSAKKCSRFIVQIVL
jgi:hypothetical protein